MKAVSALPTLHLPKAQKLANKRIVGDLLLGHSEVKVAGVAEEPALNVELQTLESSDKIRSVKQEAQNKY